MSVTHAAGSGHKHRLIAGIVVSVALLIGGCDALSTVTVPVPEGFVPTSSEFPTTFERMSKVATMDKRTPMRVAEFMIPEEAAEMLRSGHEPARLGRFLVDVRSVSDPHYSESQFEQYAAHDRSGGYAVPSDADLARLIGQSPGLVGPQGELAKVFTLTGDTRIGIVVDRPHVIGDAYVMMMKIDEMSSPMVMVSDVVWTHGHIVVLKVFSELRSVDDIHWATEEAAKWGEAAAAQ